MAKTIKSRKEILDGLGHVMRFIKAVAHEDDCECLDRPGRWCNCGRVLAMEQVQGAIFMLKRGKP